MKKQINKIKEKISELYTEMYNIQNLCPHINTNIEYGGDKESWGEPAQHWIDYECLDCGKTWRDYTS